MARPAKPLEQEKLKTGFTFAFFCKTAERVKIMRLCSNYSNYSGTFRKNSQKKSKKRINVLRIQKQFLPLRKIFNDKT